MSLRYVYELVYVSVYEYECVLCMSLRCVCMCEFGVCVYVCCVCVSLRYVCEFRCVSFGVCMNVCGFTE